VYRVVVVLLLIVLPLCSVVLEHALHPGLAWMALIAKWFVFWVVGVRLLLAGVTQILRPAYTARTIFRFKTDEALPVVREVGIANLAGGIVATASIIIPAFLLPMALWGAVYYAGAGVGHAALKERSGNENAAMLTDLYAFAILAAIVMGTVLYG